jgi:hypothetical protein
MKTLQEIINQQPVYLHNFKSKFEVVANFEDIFVTQEEMWKESCDKFRKVYPIWESINILFASYGQDNYSGDAWVLFEKDEELYEVNASHCSCYGLEGQWSPEKVELKELQHRVLFGSFGTDDYSGNEFKEELKLFLGL